MTNEMTSNEKDEELEISRKNIKEIRCSHSKLLY